MIMMIIMMVMVKVLVMVLLIRRWIVFESEDTLTITGLVLLTASPENRETCHLIVSLQMPDVTKNTHDYI